MSRANANSIAPVRVANRRWAAILSDPSPPSLDALTAAVARLTMDTDDLAGVMTLVRLATNCGDLELAKRHARSALALCEQQGDMDGLSTLACFIARAIDPEWGLTVLLNKCIARDRFEIGNFCYEEALKMAGMHELLRAILERAGAAGKMFNVNGFGDTTLAQREANIGKGYGYVFLNTMPKSGSVYLANHLCALYRTTYTRIGVDSFPRSLVIPSRVRLLAEGGLWDQMHLDASAQNLDLLAENGIRKIYLHLRDPRQATLSWLHHIDSEDMKGVNALYRLSLWKPIPADYDAMAWEAKLDWHVIHTFPAFVRWTQEWLDAIATQTDRFDIRVSEFAAFAANPDAAVEDLLSFFNVPARPDELPDAIRQQHYRKGRADEWREVFSARQQRAMAAMITPQMQERFGWV